ncbi:formate dehydrogenase [Halotalea alkalilenta]|uniref:Formate dehydrogenase n=2 Tax=Halotalea alkalilenta TaxID=376489 RepID=A0A172YER7_9GAMM|nr:formate dehydrogenase [Halotalea alkalilenta]
MTNHWVDIRNADVILVMGGNAAEAHPVGFRWVTEAKEHNNATLMVVDPRFTRTASVADYYAPIRTGTDITFLGGLIKYLIDNDRIQREYVLNYTDAALLVDEAFGFEDGLFDGYDESRRSYAKESWRYQTGADGFVLRDDSLSHPRCVYQLMRAHFDAYTPEMVSSICGTPVDRMLHVWEQMASTATEDRTLTILYALGWTQHSIGAQIIRTAGMVQLLLGNIGLPGGGVNALRGHSNIQGLTDLGLLSNQLPGYIAAPAAIEQSLAGFLDARRKMPTVADQVSYWQHMDAFFISLMKAWYGERAQADNDWCYGWLPKLTQPLYDVLDTFDRMSRGEIYGYFCQGFNPLAAIPDKNKVSKALAKLKYLVSIDPLNTETAEFWRNAGEFNDVDPSEIQTEVFRLPANSFAEDEGSIVNSARWLQWHYVAADGPGESMPDTHIIGALFHRVRELYASEGGAFPEPILNLAWDYKQPERPEADEIAREFNGRALADIRDPNGVLVRRAGEQLSGFSELRDDGSTLSGCWVFAGAWTEQGNQMANRDNSDPYGNGQTLGWAWAWPANRRILYNRAAARPDGTPWAPRKALIWWNEAQSRWVGSDVPDFPANSPPALGQMPFIMNPEGVGHLFAGQSMNDGPFPTHYEPFESPVPEGNLLFPRKEKVKNNPAARIFDADRAMLGDWQEFPHAATTYRLTEHFHYWTKHSHLNAVVQPEQFVEIGEALGNELGIRAGDWVKVSSKRGYIRAVAVVTKRIRAITVGGRIVHQVGIPIHWGFLGQARKGFLANTLTPSVGDANTQTPEYKSFLVKVEKDDADHGGER